MPVFFKKKDEKKITLFNKILIVISGYFLIPLILSIPYSLSIYNITFLDCYFEFVMSCIGTSLMRIENHFQKNFPYKSLTPRR